MWRNAAFMLVFALGVGLLQGCSSSNRSFVDVSNSADYARLCLVNQGGHNLRIQSPAARL